MSLLLTSSLSPTFSFSPIVSPFVTPVSKVVSNPYSTTVYTTNIVNPWAVPVFPVEIDTGMNDSYITQNQVIEYFQLRVLDKWLWKDDMCHLLKYLKITNGKVEFVSSENDYKGNKICNDTRETAEKKVDFIESHFLSKNDMRKILTQIIQELSIPWTSLTTNERLIVEVTEKYLKKKLRARIGSKE